MKASYDVSDNVGRAPTRDVSVSQRVTFTNTTGATLDRAVMRATWHRWDGVFTLGEVKAGGVPAQTAWRYGVNLEIALPQPLPANAQTTIELDYRLKPRPVGGRTGYDRASDVLALGDAVVTLVAWELGGWSYYPYSELGDFGNGVAASYRVEVRSTGGERLVVGGTGDVTRRPDGTSYLFESKGVRDVAYIISPRFIDPLSDTSMTRRVDDVRLLGYFPPEHREAGRRQLDLSAQAFAWFSDTIGPYPFDTFTVAAMGAPTLKSDNYAQEYPGIYLIPAPWLRLAVVPGEWTWYIPAHEVGHQWFYSTVGNNQLADPWLDEALTTYLTAEYTRLRYPDLYATAWRSMTGAALRSRPVSAGVFAGYASEAQYTAVVYDSGTLMLDRVRRAMGDADFYTALRDYYSQHALQRAGPLALIRTLQSHSGADLTGIFAEYLGY
jgi:aminopeptidase N